MRPIDRGSFLVQAASRLVAKPSRLLIDSHIEVWTIDPKFPFKHPENPNAKPNSAAPIENQIEQMKDFGIKYGVLITPRYFGWDNSYTEYALRKASEHVRRPRPPQSSRSQGARNFATGSRKRAFRGCGSVPSIIPKSPG